MSQTKRRFQRFRLLQWKLTVSYMLTTILVWLLLALLIFFLSFWILVSHIPSTIGDNAQQLANDMEPFINKASVTHNELLKQLKAAENLPVDSQIAYQHTLILVDTHGKALASSGKYPVADGTDMQKILPRQAAQHLRTLFLPGNGYFDPADQTSQEAGETFIAVMPVLKGDTGTVQGAMILLAYQPHISPNFLGTILPGLVGFTFILLFFGGICGSIFGFFSARGFTRRFNRLSLVVNQWSTGDFSLFAKDMSSDEIGQLAHQLNHMAEQLQNLLTTRHKMAKLEERNRLARDLHDSVKQQLFAVSLQVRTAKKLIERNPSVAQGRLDDAEGLIRQAQQELTSLIRELRPIALEERSLVPTLQELVVGWSQQTAVAASLQLGEQHPVAPQVEEALYRITQEALSNVIRHSQARNVQIQFTSEPKEVTLRISDDGKGFEVGTTKDQGVGLRSMHERLQAFGGSFSIESSSNQGTTLTARCPRMPETNIK